MFNTFLKCLVPVYETPKKIGSKGCILLNSGMVRSRTLEMCRVGNGAVFSQLGIFFYGQGLSFDSSEMIYITIHQRIKK